MARKSPSFGAVPVSSSYSKRPSLCTEAMIDHSIKTWELAYGIKLHKGK